MKTKKYKKEKVTDIKEAKEIIDKIIASRENSNKIRSMIETLEQILKKGL